MIKINKDLLNIPESLKPATEDFFPLPGLPPKPSITTSNHRLKFINDGSYTDSGKYNDRYKYADVRSALALIYHGKCAYCEQKVEQTHVEHYRHKNNYYWLAYSWDNLLLACPHCNEYKGVNFELEGVKVTFVNTLANIRNINSLSASYDFRELPKMVNPEITNPVTYIVFEQSGAITSNNTRFAYTIEKCKLSRTYLRDERRKLLNDFRDDIAAELLLENKDRRIAGIQALIAKFKRDSEKIDNPFLAYRRFAIKHNWLKIVIKELLQNHA